MNLREIFRFEFVYQVRRLTTWLYFAALVVVMLPVVIGNYAGSARDGGFLLNSPYVIAAATVFGTLIWTLFGGAVAGKAGARDFETRLYPLLFTSPIGKAEYLGGRFLAALAINVIILLALTVGMVVAFNWPVEVDPATLGPYRPLAFLGAYAFVALPSAFVVTAVQFGVATLTGRTMASFAGGLLLLAVPYLVTLVVATPPDWPELATMLDPLAFITVVGDLSTSWTAAEKSTRLLALDGWLLWNRLLWIGVGIAALIFTYARFRFAHPAPSPWWSRLLRRRAAHSPAPGFGVLDLGRTIAVPFVRQTFGLPTYARQTLAIGWTSFTKIALSPGGLVMLALVAFMAFVAVVEDLHQMGVPLSPRTDIVLQHLVYPEIPPAYLIVPLLLVFWSGELVWRERAAGLSDIIDASPAPEWVLFLGKLLGLALLLALCMALRTAAGMAQQVGAGVYDFEFLQYARVLFGLQLTEYLQLAVLGLFVHTVVNHRSIGHLAVFLSFFATLIVTNEELAHPLIAYGFDPGWTFTDMRGFGASLVPWLWFTLYWTAWGLLLAVATTLLWVRGKERGLAARLRIARGRIRLPTAWVTAAAAMLAVTSGAFVFYNTNVLHEADATLAAFDRRAEYERRYGQFEGLPQPRITGVNLQVDLYPKRAAVEARGSYRLVNDTATAIESIHLATVAQAETGAVRFDRAARLVVVDDEHGHHIYALEPPLAPGETLQLDFTVRSAQRGFHRGGADAAVLANGTYLTSEMLPALGYQPGREVSDGSARDARGLPPRRPIPTLEDAPTRDPNFAARASFEAIVATDADQVAVAPGLLRRTWTEGGRRYFHYVAEAPIGAEYAFLSAAYAIHAARWNDVAIQVFHDPRHTRNLDRIVRSAQATLAYCTEQFGPYPHGYVRFIERPGLGVGLHAETADITYQEGYTLLDPDADFERLDLVFAVAAHETAHLCAGFAYAPVEGAGVLSESLAWYVALQVVKATYGEEQFRTLLRRMQRPFPISPVRNAPPLLRANNEYLAYRKAAFALVALAEYAGKERVNAALRRLWETHRGVKPPLATTVDLYRELQAVTPDELQYLVRDLFASNTFWEFTTERVTAEQTAAGTWQVALDVRAHKVAVDTAGVETEGPMDDWVEVGVFAGDGDALGAPLYLQKHRIVSGRQTITVTVPARPAFAGVDPYGLLIEWTRTDNTARVNGGS